MSSYLPLLFHPRGWLMSQHVLHPACQRAMLFRYKCMCRLQLDSSNQCLQITDAKPLHTSHSLTWFSICFNFQEHSNLFILFNILLILQYMHFDLLSLAFWNINQWLFSSLALPVYTFQSPMRHFGIFQELCFLKDVALFASIFMGSWKRLY